MKKQKKEAGFIVTAELVLVATILVIGMVVGMAIVRDAVTAEMNDVAEAIGSVNQSYYYAGIFAGNGVGTLAIVVGSQFEDSQDVLAGDTIPPNYVIPPPPTENTNF